MPTPTFHLGDVEDYPPIQYVLRSAHNQTFTLEVWLRQREVQLCVGVVINCISRVSACSSHSSFDGICSHSRVLLGHVLEARRRKFSLGLSGQRGLTPTWGSAVDCEESCRQQMWDFAFGR